MIIIGKIKNFLVRLQELPEQEKKIILWVIVAILAIVMGFFWLPNAIKNLSKVGGAFSNINIDEVKIVDKSSLDSISSTIDKIAKISNNTDWNIYKNKKYNFEIRYPLDWSFREYDSGAAFFPKNKLEDNLTGNGSINVGFYQRGSDYCKISFEDYVKIAGPSEIQNFESLNTIDSVINFGGVEAYQIKWNYIDMQGLGKISLPITYFKADDKLCGSVEVFLNDNNYSDIYNEIISTFNFVVSEK